MLTSDFFNQSVEENCKYGRYYCTTDKKYKCRQGPKQTRTSESVTEEVNPIDTVEMDVPLLIRALEYAREDAKDDMDLHKVVERMIATAQAGEPLNMDDYNMIFGDQEEPAVEVEEAKRKKKKKSSLMSKPTKRGYGGYFYPGYGYYGDSGDSGGGDGGGGGESRVKENVKEAQESPGQDYQKMLQFVNNQRLNGVPADQQVAVALFKELEKQRAINKHMDSELKAAEELVSSNKKQGDVTSSELTKNRSGLEKEKIKQQATKQQLQTLAQQLDQLRSTPDIDPEVTSAIEKQIAELQQKMQDTKGTGIDSNKVAELESAIAKIKQSETVDAEQFKKLQQQFKDAEQAAISAKDRVGQVKDYTTQIEKLNAEIDDLTKTISTDKKQINDLNVSIASVITPKIQELDKENEFVYNEL